MADNLQNKKYTVEALYSGHHWIHQKVSAAEKSLHKECVHQIKSIELISFGTFILRPLKRDGR